MRKLSCYVLSVLVVTMWVFCCLAGEAGAQGTKEPIKIGILSRATGGFAILGISQTSAAKQFFGEKGLRINDRPVKLIIEDTEGKADLALTKAKKLVEFDKVNALCVFLSSYEGYAIRDYLHEQKVPAVMTTAGAAHSRDRFSPHLFRVAPSTFQYMYEPSKWWFKKGYKRVIFVGGDYAPAREAHVAFKKGFEEAGGKIVQEVWPPVGTADFGPFLTSLKVGEADAIIGAMWGDMPIRFVNQWVEYGLKKRIPLIGVATFLDEGVTLPGMGANADGVLSWFTSCAQSDTAENKRFVEGYKKENGMLPGHYAYLAYVSAQAVYTGLAETANVEDKEKLRDAIGKIRFAAPMGGEVYFDSKNAMIYDMIFLEARKTDKECHLFEIGRIKGVSDPYEVFP